MTPHELIIRKKELWAEIKAMEREYNRLQKQIEAIESDKARLMIDVKRKLDQVQEIGEELAEVEVEYLKKHE